MQLALWWARLDVAVAPFATDVPEDERARAAAFRRPGDGDRYLVSRAHLRRLLARELGGAPAAVAIVGEKPRVDGSDLFFSLARSGGVALYALSRTTEVGVDVEQIRPGADMDGVAARFFTPAERAALARLADPARTAAAFACWARKEAYAKATGTGLTFRLADVEVGVGGAGPATAGGWTLRDVPLEGGFAAAVAGRWPPGFAPPAPRPLQSNAP